MTRKQMKKPTKQRFRLRSASGWRNTQLSTKRGCKNSALPSSGGGPGRKLRFVTALEGFGGTQRDSKKAPLDRGGGN